MEKVTKLKEVVSTDYLHVDIEHRPSQSMSDLVNMLKGLSYQKCQQEFLAKDRVLGLAFWAIGFMVLEYRLFNG